MLADVLKQNSVDNSGMRFDPNARTALAIVKLRAEGEREFMFSATTVLIWLFKNRT
jgi:fructokinase